MPNQQLARGLWAQFANNEAPFNVPNGMEENLRHIDDHLALYTLLPPQAPGTPLPGDPFDGDGQVYTDGSYATFNGGTWLTYAPRKGIRVVLASGTESWLNTGTGWEQFSVVDTGPAMQAAVAAASAAQAARTGAEVARDAAMLSAGVYATTAAGLAATTSGKYFNVPAGDAAVSLILYLNSAGVAVEQKRYPSLEALNNLQANSIRDSVNRRFLSPGGGTFSGGAADTTGAFKIALPAGVSGHMLSVDLIITDNYGALHLTINGFNFPGGTWYYTGVVGQSSHAYLRAPTIRWGNDGSRDCIWIGETSYNIWAYPQVHVNRMSIGGIGEAGFNSGWDISLVTSFAGTVSDPKTASVGQLLGSEAITDLNFKRIFNPGGGIFTGGAADTTGAIKIKLPPGAPQTNVVIGVTVMDNYGIMRLRIGGFNNDGAWLYTKAAIESDHQFQAQPSIRWGNDGIGDCIWIGELAVNFWAYPQVWITDVVVNSGDYGWAGSGWAVSLVTAFDTVTAGPVLPAKSMPNVNPTFSEIGRAHV